ncbi:hypothetical protein BHE90_017614, partial [Fusarium euwallaceae]
YTSEGYRGTRFSERLLTLVYKRFLEKAELVLKNWGEQPNEWTETGSQGPV